MQKLPLQLAVIDDQDGFAALADEWRHLAQGAGTSFFLSWEWHYTWWQVYSTPKDRLNLVRISANDELVAILPMYSRDNGLVQGRTLHFIGTGEAREDEVATEYLDLIVHPDFELAAAGAALDWLSGAHSWNKVELRNMLSDAVLVRAYRVREDLFIAERQVGYRYRADLTANEAQYLNGLSKSRAKRLERSRKALTRDGGLEQQSVNNMAELNAAFHQLAELNHERQDHKKRKSVFASAKFIQFHKDLFERVFNSGAVNIHRFKLGHNLLAVIYCFYDESTCYYYQSGFAKRMANKYMPLTFAHLAEMQRNRDGGKQYYDLMRGEPPTYKEDFGCQTTPMVTTYLFSSSFGLQKFKAIKLLRKNIVRLLARAGIKRE